MSRCGYVMCDGYECLDEGTIIIDGDMYCDDHAEALHTGVDPMIPVEDQYDM